MILRKRLVSGVSALSVHTTSDPAQTARAAWESAGGAGGRVHQDYRVRCGCPFPPRGPLWPTVPHREHPHFSGGARQALKDLESVVLRPVYDEENRRVVPVGESVEHALQRLVRTAPLPRPRRRPDMTVSCARSASEGSTTVSLYARRVDEARAVLSRGSLRASHSAPSACSPAVAEATISQLVRARVRAGAGPRRALALGGVRAGQGRRRGARSGFVASTVNTAYGGRSRSPGLGDRPAARDVVRAWIEVNPPRPGDAWHPYTTSTRIGNWVAAATLLPELTYSALPREPLEPASALVAKRRGRHPRQPRDPQRARARARAGWRRCPERLCRAGPGVFSSGSCRSRCFPTAVTTSAAPLHHLVVLRDLLEVEAAAPGSVPAEVLERMRRFSAAPFPGRTRELAFVQRRNA